MSNVIAFPKTLTRQRLAARNDLDMTAHAASTAMLATFAGAEIINLDTVRRERDDAARRVRDLATTPGPVGMAHGNAALAIAPSDIALAEWGEPARDGLSNRPGAEHPEHSAEVIDFSEIRLRRAG